MNRVLRLSAMMAAVSAAVLVWSFPDSFVLAQSGKTKPKKPVSAAEIGKLDAKLESIQRSFLNDTASIITGYENAGQYDRAKLLLEVLLKLEPNNEDIKKKIDKLNERSLDLSEFEMELDPSKSWQQVGMVGKDKLIRLEVEGEYKFSVSMPVGAEGVSTKDPANDLVGGVPLGAVVAVIFPPDAAGARTDPNNQPKPPNPFKVGEKLEQTVKQEGMLLIKVNVPPGSKCTGKLKVKVSGVTKA